MKRNALHIILLLALHILAHPPLHAQQDTTHTIKRLIDELTTHPKFKGDVYEYIAKHIRYPYPAKENGVEGTIWVRFIIDENGNVSDAALVSKRRLGAGLEEEAIRVVKTMPAWQPGTYKDKPVRVVYTLPVHFKLE